MAAGRPRVWTDEKIVAEGEALLKWFREAPERYWLKAFAIERRYPAEYFSRWAKQNKPFYQALKMAKDIQEARIVQNAASGKMHATVAIFALKNVAGWRDSKDLNVADKRDKSGEGDYETPEQQLKRAKAELEQAEKLVEQEEKARKAQPAIVGWTDEHQEKCEQEQQEAEQGRPL